MAQNRKRGGLIDRLYFKFPTRIYDPDSLKAMVEASTLDTGSKIEPAWVLGYMRVPYSVMIDAVWADTNSNSKDVKQVYEDGFDTTVIITRDRGDLYCSWNRKEFESRLEKFIEQFEDTGEDGWSQEKEID